MKKMNKMLKKIVSLTIIIAAFTVMANTPAFASSEGIRWYISAASGLALKIKETATYHTKPLVLRSAGLRGLRF